MRIVIGGVPKGNRRDHNIVRVSSFASVEGKLHVESRNRKQGTVLNGSG